MGGGLPVRATLTRQWGFFAIRCFTRVRKQTFCLQGANPAIPRVEPERAAGANVPNTDADRSYLRGTRAGHPALRMQCIHSCSGRRLCENPDGFAHASGSAVSRQSRWWPRQLPAQPFSTHFSFDRHAGGHIPAGSSLDNRCACRSSDSARAPAPGEKLTVPILLHPCC